MTKEYSFYTNDTAGRFLAGCAVEWEPPLKGDLVSIEKLPYRITDRIFDLCGEVRFYVELVPDTTEPCHDLPSH